MYKTYHRSYRHTHHHSRLLNQLWNFLTSSTMAFMLAVSAILIGYYQFYLSRPILEYTSSTDKVISSTEEDGIHIHINGIDYKNIYKSVVTLTNSGEEALSGNDVSPIGHDPIRIPIPAQIKVIYYNVDYENTSPDVSVKLENINNSIIIKFSFLNPGNSISVNLFSEQNYSQFKIIGSAAGVNEINQTLNHKQAQKIMFLGILGLIAFYSLFTFLYFRHHRRLPRI
ncbi:MAG: hypothetical protein J6K16_01745 [Alphaproteobacteria bacterium]|nr:hypothetical protein [Alphaproteobacteria bacterium]